MKFDARSFLIPMRRANAKNPALLLLLLLLLAACAPQDGGDPAAAVEQYLTAKIAGDEAALRPLLCSAMEADLRREVTSFASVDAQLDGMDCARSGDSDIVTCAGQITATYGTEQTSFPLASYRVVQEDGEWKWCGEGE